MVEELRLIAGFTKLSQNTIIFLYNISLYGCDGLPALSHRRQQNLSEQLENPFVPKEVWRNRERSLPAGDQRLLERALLSDVDNQLSPILDARFWLVHTVAAATGL